MRIKSKSGHNTKNKVARSRRAGLTTRGHGRVRAIAGARMLAARTTRAIGRGRVASSAGAGGAGGAGFADSSSRRTTRETARKETLPLMPHFLIDAVRDEDEEALQRGDERHEHEHDDAHDRDLSQNRVEEGKQPGQPDSDEDGHEDAEFFAILALLSFRRLGESAVNFTRHEEEQDGVDADQDEARQEEQAEDIHGVRNVARAVHRLRQTVLAIRSDDDHGNARHAPCYQVIELLEFTCPGVPFHDHLVEIESDTCTPNKIGEQEIVNNSAKYDADG